MRSQPGQPALQLTELTECAQAYALLFFRADPQTLERRPGRVVARMYPPLTPAECTFAWPLHLAADCKHLFVQTNRIAYAADHQSSIVDCASLKLEPPMQRRPPWRAHGLHPTLMSLMYRPRRVKRCEGFADFDTYLAYVD